MMAGWETYPDERWIPILFQVICRENSEEIKTGYAG